MTQPSSYGSLKRTLSDSGGQPTPSWPTAAVGALDGAAFGIPLSLGAVTLLYARLAPEALAAAVLATLAAMALVQLAGVWSRRPVLYAARFFEATTLAVMMDNLIVRLPVWGLADTSGVRIALFICLVTAAGLCTMVLYLLRADRFTRYIPAPVFAGFQNSIAVALLISQVETLQHVLAGPATAGLAGGIVILLAVLAACFGIRRWLPRWPAAACGLAIGLVLGVAFASADIPLGMVGGPGAGWTVPFLLADFHALAAARLPDILPVLGGNAMILGTMMFLNTSLTAQMLSHADDKPADTRGTLVRAALVLAGSGLLGAAPLSGSSQSSLAATRRAVLSPALGLCSVSILVVVAATGMLAWVPLTAVIAALLSEAWFMVDRPSLRLLGQWLRRDALSRPLREDLALVAAVTLTAVLINMVAAVLAGLLLGLVLFAARNARRPVRAIRNATQAASLCARSRADLLLLAQHADQLRVVELEGDLFFGTVNSLEHGFARARQGALAVVVDWRSVRHVDSSVRQAVRKLERDAHAAGVSVVHVDPALADAEVAATLQLASHGSVVAPDHDRALEEAENVVLRAHGRGLPGADQPTTSMLDAVSLFRGLSMAERQMIESRMTQRLFQPGERVVTAGEPGDTLMVVLQGSASVLVTGEAGRTTRVAGLRRGALIGEMSFLDRAPRSAHVEANDTLLAAQLTRADFDEFNHLQPALVQKLLTNMVLDVSARLRRSNQIALASQNGGA